MCFRKIGENPVRVYIRNRTGEDTQKVCFRFHSNARSKQSNVEVRDDAWSADANAHKEKSTAIQMGTDDTKGYSGGFDIVLYEVSTDIITEHACRFECLGLWEFVVKNNCKMSDCSSPVKRTYTLTSTPAHAFILNTNPPYLSPSNVRPQKKKEKSIGNF